MYVTGNPAAQIWKKIMGPVHDGLEYKSFPLPSIGADTKIFGDLADALEEQNNPSPTPSESPSPPPSESPAESEPPVSPSEPVVPPTDPDDPEPPEPSNPVGDGFEG